MNINFVVCRANKKKPKENNATLYSRHVLFLFCFIATADTGWSKKVSHLRIITKSHWKLVKKARFFINLSVKSTRMPSVSNRYSTRDLICDVIKYCATLCDVAKISVYDKKRN